jgi:2-keto-4-pentenoate hydratase
LCIEPEITFRLERDLPPRDERYRPDEVAKAVIACPSFEIVDTRFDTSDRSIRQRLNERATLVELFADHQSSGAFVAGDGRADWPNFDFAIARVVMRADDEVIVESVGGHAFSDPFLPLVVLANEMRRRDGLRAGQLLATGSFTGVFPVEVDRKISAEFEGFGTVEAMFVDR